MLVIPAERAGAFPPASESRNPVNDLVGGLTQGLVYWVPARARPLGRARLAGTTAIYDCPAVRGDSAPELLQGGGDEARLQHVLGGRCHRKVAKLHVEVGGELL